VNDKDHDVIQGPACALTGNGSVGDSDPERGFRDSEQQAQEDGAAIGMAAVWV